jgi:hypothetical protein
MILIYRQHSAAASSGPRAARLGPKPEGCPETTDRHEREDPTPPRPTTTARELAALAMAAQPERTAGARECGGDGTGGQGVARPPLRRAGRRRTGTEAQGGGGHTTHAEVVPDRIGEREKIK